MELEKIIGTKDSDSTRVMPALNIYSKPYALPATTIGIAPGKFVVVPPNFSDWERLEAVKVALNPPTPESAFNVKRAREVNNAGE